MDDGNQFILMRVTCGADVNVSETLRGQFTSPTVTRLTKEMHTHESRAHTHTHTPTPTPPHTRTHVRMHTQADR